MLLPVLLVAPAEAAPPRNAAMASATEAGPPAARPKDSSAGTDPRLGVLAAMKQELSRSMADLRLPGYEKPYFIDYTVRDYDKREVVGRLGALFTDSRRRYRQAYVQVRVGSYRFDNTSDTTDITFDLDGDDAYQPSNDAPIEDDRAALRSALWQLTDQAYKNALSAYATKRGRRATELSEDANLPSFSREKPSRYVAPPIDAPFPHDRAAGLVRRLSRAFRAYPDLFDGEVRVGVEKVTRYLENSEGSEVLTGRAIFSVYLSAATRAKDGMLLQHEKSAHAFSFDGLPSEEELLALLRQMATELRELRAAPVVDPYTGPAILEEQAAGVFFHEAVGHRLEGERQNNEKEGRTFKGQIGKRILPAFLSVYDDPTLERAGGETLNGYYRYDDEGVPAREVTLIDHGVLRDYLMSRTPIKGSLHSNGHGRAEGVADPMGRMANLIIRSTKRVSPAKLKQMLLEEVRRQKKPYGLIIRDITGGYTNTTNYGFQAFKGQPRLVYRVDAKTGKETLVRGVEMVGTPLASINKIVATSDTEGVFNGFCGAESGYVPVSTVAPAVLMSEIELQRSERALERPLILPPPWAPKPSGK